jgi:hypothetical protein
MGAQNLAVPQAVERQEGDMAGECLGGGASRKGDLLVISEMDNQDGVVDFGEHAVAVEFAQSATTDFRQSLLEYGLPMRPKADLQSGACGKIGERIRRSDQRDALDIQSGSDRRSTLGG